MDITTRRTVGKSRLEVTPLGFGGGTIGMGWITNQTSLDTVAAAWDTGVRFYDTAPFYGMGRSERRLGLALSGIAERDQYRINTKIGKSLVPEPVEDKKASSKTPSGSERTPRDPATGFRLQFEFTHDRILEQHQDSLQRLGTSTVDSLTIHDLDYGYQTVERAEHHLNELSRDGGGGAIALETLRAEGSIQAIGSGCNLESRNAYSWEDGAHERLTERIADLVDLDFFTVAGGYTLLETRALRRIFPLCQERGIGVIVAAPFAGGWLVSGDETASYMYGRASPEIVDRSRRMRAICERHGVPLAAAALQFPLAHPVVAAVIPGARSPEEPQENHRLLQTEIPADVWREFVAEGVLDPAAPTPE